jgi:hypothetical protein
MQAHAPGPTEYFPYYGKYVELVKTDDILATLAQQPSETVALLSGLTEERGNFSYAPGKWSIKQMLGQRRRADLRLPRPAHIAQR